METSIQCNLCKVQAPQPLKASWWGELMPSQTLFMCQKKKRLPLCSGVEPIAYLQDQAKITWTWFFAVSKYFLLVLRRNIQYQDLLFVGFKATPRALCFFLVSGCMGLVYLPTFTMKISQMWVDNWKICVTSIMHGSYGYIEVILVILKL